MTQDEGRQRLIGAWIDAFDGERPQLDRVRLRTRIVTAFEASRPRPLVARWAWGGFATAAALAAALFLVARVTWWSPPTFTVAGQRGEVGEWLATNDAEQLPLDFSEGTHVAIAAGSRARVEEVNRRGARVVIERGSLSAHVTHKSDSAWHFGAGPFDVLVVGTSLSVNWDPAKGAFELGVQRGSVVVKGPVIQGAQEVRAGERCSVDLVKQAMHLEEASRPHPSPTSNLDPQPEVPTAPEVTEPVPPAGVLRAPSSSGPAWSTLARDGKYGEAVAAAERGGLARIYQAASSDELLELARSARQAGRSDIEHDALLACRQRFKGQPAAAKAAYQLGSTAAPKEAAQWFETYLREQPGGVLSREAAGRLIESHQRAGNTAGARDAATRYLASYPDGPHAARARSVLSTTR